MFADVPADPEYDRPRLQNLGVIVRSDLAVPLVREGTVDRRT